MVHDHSDEIEIDMEEEANRLEMIENPEIKVEEAVNNAIEEELNVSQTEIATPHTHDEDITEVEVKVKYEVRDVSEDESGTELEENEADSTTSNNNDRIMDSTSTADSTQDNTDGDAYEEGGGVTKEIHRHS